MLCLRQKMEREVEMTDHNVTHQLITIAEVFKMGLG